ncbi:MAG: SUMF1/EgtB/PvdO family nonheme iron enzyme [Deltaproteobacteria bacterium]|nr:SUMF1/EgtB/PvdO family nonheme iron enzyme [Deltaproteobacteria bacterium]
MKPKNWLYIGMSVVLFLWFGGKVYSATECTGDIEFCSQVSSTESRESPPINCVQKFPDNAIPVDAKYGYVLVNLKNVAQGDTAIAECVGPGGHKWEKPFEQWGSNRAAWYEVVQLPLNELLEAPGTWTFTYYVKSPNNPMRRELCSTTFIVAPSLLEIDGIWKDTAETISFYVQTYTAGSAVVIATKDLNTFYTFLDPYIRDGIDINDLANHGHHLSATFNDSSHGTADLTLSGSPPQSYTLKKVNGLLLTPSYNGIWKSPSCSGATMSYYVQTYDTGSAIVVGTSDLASYYVFLDPDFSDGMNANELSGKSFCLSMSFGSAGLEDTLERCVQAPLSGSHQSAVASLTLLNEKCTPQIDVSPLTLDFGTVTIGESLDKTFSIENTGSGTLTVSSFVGLPDKGFSFVNPPVPPFTVSPGASQSITIRFTPDSSGTKTTLLWVISNSPEYSSVSVQISGNSDNPNIEVNPASLDFGVVEIWSHSDNTFTIWNEGTDTLTVSSFVGLPDKGFSFVTPPTTPFSVSPGESQPITVRFSPDSASVKTTHVWVHSNAPGEDSVTVSLSGTGCTSCVDFYNSLGMTFKYIPPGTFTMGSPTIELGERGGEYQHQVKLTKGFYMQTTEVTQAQWKAVMGSNPSYFDACGDGCPVEDVSWEEVQTFISYLNTIEEDTYRLPTEAEWEYACRSGTSTAFANGEITQTEYRCSYDQNLHAVGWYCYNSQDTPHPVARKTPNFWGLYDMHGNVSEYVQDWFEYDYYFFSPVTDPTGPISGTHKIQRGGSWMDDSQGCRSAQRFAYTITLEEGFVNIGFRIVKEYP